MAKTNEHKSFILAQYHECTFDERIRRPFITHLKVSRTESKFYFAKSFKEIHEFVKTGSTLKPNVHHPIRINDTPCVAKFVENPNLSLNSDQQSLANEDVKVSKETIRTLFRRKNMKPYKEHSYNLPQNVEKRVGFALWFFKQPSIECIKDSVNRWKKCVLSQTTN